MGKKRIGEEWKEMKKKVREAIRGTDRELIKEEEREEEWWEGVHKEEKRVEDGTEEMEENSWRKTRVQRNEEEVQRNLRKQKGRGE